MQLALRKRPVSSERIDAAVGAIEHKLSAMGEREVRSSKLGELVLEALRGMDTIAWIRFASFYLNINDPKAFAEMIEQALREAPAAAEEDAAGLETGEFYGVPETDESVEVADSPIELSDDSDPKGQLASSDPDGYIRKKLQYKFYVRHPYSQPETRLFPVGTMPVVQQSANGMEKRDSRILYRQSGQ